MPVGADYYYQLSWSSCDGAGSSDEQILDQDEAIRRAQQKQADTEKDGNPWGYAYRVRRTYLNCCRTDDVYNARSHTFYAYWGPDGTTIRPTHLERGRPRTAPPQPGLDQEDY